jgi:hypothetical protein
MKVRRPIVAVAALAAGAVAVPGVASAGTGHSVPTAYTANADNGTVTPINTATNKPGKPMTGRGVRRVPGAG